MNADIAPLPPSVADHLFRRFARARKNPADAEALFLETVREKRRDTFDVLDPFVRAGALTRAIIFDKLRVYGHEISKNTLTNWQQSGLVEMERHGEIKPLSAQSLLIAAMIDPGQRGFLPPSGVLPGESWHCYIQRGPYAPIETWPVGHLKELSPTTLCWTPCASAYWEDPGWYPIGVAEGFLGCIRFAGMKMIRRYPWYEVDIETIRAWDTKIADLYEPFEGDTQASLQILCYPLFHKLAKTRLGRKG